MSRPIKFRGLRKGKWYEFGFKNGGLFWDAEVVKIIALGGITFEAFVQFTGFFDRYGTKIWEGDIVRFVNEEQGYDKHHVIEWKSVGFLSNGWHILLDYPETTAQVIGNIYENPELLK